MNDRFDFGALFGEFKVEAEGQLDVLDRALLKLEEEGGLDAEETTKLLRVLHTLKGNSSMLGIRAIADQVHALENVFKAVRGSRPSDLDALFELSARLRSVLDRLGTPEQEAALAGLAAVDVGSLAEQGASADRPTPETGGRPTRPPPEVPGPAARPGEVSVDAGVAESIRPEVGSQAEFLRVDFGKLDLLLARVGELFGLHARMEDFLERHRKDLLAADMHRELEERVEDLGVLAATLQDTTMDLRLVPLRTVLGRFPAMVRDLARGQNKRARLVIEGGDIELDKTAVDALGEPLLHLVRNAVDHGIEAPDVRERAGKDPTGEITIRSEREGDHIVVRVSDDGSGLDRAEILRRAAAAGLIGSPDEVDAEALRDLIFAPGFSTREEATTLSGRGMGLDIARQSLARLRGSITVEPESGEGTTFTLRLPLTLAIVPALIFESDGEMLAVPTADVGETLARAAHERVGGAEIIRAGPEVIPLAWPARLFGWRQGEPAGASPRFSIVIRRGGRTAAIPADRLVDQRSLVVKALPAYVGGIRGVSGATVAPDGRVILLLDSEAFLELNLQAQGRSASGR